MGKNLRKSRRVWSDKNLFDILIARSKGKTFNEIGELYGISGNQARVLFKKIAKTDAVYYVDPYNHYVWR